ncbi:MAG: extracellular solute-binding protein, partial [Actinobacteria bacterium]|nr:extracellular solute-binding protein [Actinomycetota bacterium]
MTVRLGGRLFSVVAAGTLAIGLAACGNGNSSGSGSGSGTIPHDTIAQLKSKANQEGSVNWYTTFADSDVKPMVDAFNKQFPNIKINALRLSADQIPPRVITEQKGHKYNADVVSGDSPQIAQLQQAGALQPYDPPDQTPLPSGLSL